MVFTISFRFRNCKVSKTYSQVLLPIPRDLILSQGLGGDWGGLMAFVWWPDQKKLSQEGFASVAHVPVLFGTDWQYLGEANRYLRERALLEWQPGKEPSLVRFRPKYPTRQTLENIVRGLCNFLEWTQHRSIDWKSLDYTNDIVNG